MTTPWRSPNKVYSMTQTLKYMSLQFTERVRTNHHRSRQPSIVTSLKNAVYWTNVHPTHATLCINGGKQTLHSTLPLSPRTCINYHTCEDAMCHATVLLTTMQPSGWFHFRHCIGRCNSSSWRSELLRLFIILRRRREYCPSHTMVCMPTPLGSPY